MNNLPISRLINVDVVLAPVSAQAQDLSTLLVLGTSDVIDVVERLRTYSTLDEVATDFGTLAQEYLSAVLWFEQVPQPNVLKIGRWANADTAARLRGASISAAQQAIAAWNAITTPVFEVILNGIPRSVAPATFAASQNLNNVASIIQTALAAIVPNSTCVWNANLQRFEIEDGVTGVGSTISFVKPPTAVGNITFSLNPTNNDTITLGGTTVTFKSALPGANQVLIGINLAATLANLLTFLQGSTDANLIKFLYNVTGTVLTLEAAVSGPSGNALAIAASAAVASGATLSGGTGQDISSMLGMLATSSGAYIANGIAAETAAAAVALFDAQFGQTWYAATIPSAADADQILAAQYIEGSNNKHLFGISTQEAGVISPVSTADIAYMVKALNLSRTVVVYSSSNPYAVSSLLGRALTVDYNGNSTVITLMYKQLPGITAENLTTSQIDALEAKNCNVFAAYNNDTAIVEPGKMASGDFVDTLTGTDWLAVTIMTALYNLLYQSTTKIPQTDAGTHLLVVNIANILSQGIANGLLAPGVWNANGFGTLKQGDFMPTGFYVYAPPVSSQLQSDREARRSVPIQVAAKLAGAIHSVDVTINVNR